MYDNNWNITSSLIMPTYSSKNQQENWAQNSSIYGSTSPKNTKIKHIYTKWIIYNKKTDPNMSFSIEISSMQYMLFVMWMWTYFILFFVMKLMLLSCVSKYSYQTFIRNQFDLIWSFALFHLLLIETFRQTRCECWLWQSKNKFNPNSSIHEKR